MTQARRTARYTSATLTDRTSKSSRPSIRFASILSGCQMGKASSIASMRATRLTSFSTILNLGKDGSPREVASMASVHSRPMARHSPRSLPAIIRSIFMCVRPKATTASSFGSPTANPSNQARAGARTERSSASSPMEKMAARCSA